MTSSRSRSRASAYQIDSPRVSAKLVIFLPAKIGVFSFPFLAGTNESPFMTVSQRARARAKFAVLARRVIAGIKQLCRMIDRFVLRRR